MMNGGGRFAIALSLLIILLLDHCNQIFGNDQLKFRRLSAQENAYVNKICGLSALKEEKFHNDNNTEAEFKVSLGTVAEVDEFPWALKLFPVDSEGENILLAECTASLVSLWHFITAAHCLNYETSQFSNAPVRDNYFAIGGAPCIYQTGLMLDQMPCNITVNESKALLVRSFIVPISSLNYLKASNPYIYPYSDIAIFELEEPISKAFKHMVPICLPQPNEPTPDYAIAYGYGITDESAAFFPRYVMNTELKWITMPRYPIAQWLCDSVFERTKCDNFITYLTTSASNKTWCSGDSGGGMMALIKKRYVLVGIVSRSDSYCDSFEIPNNLGFQSTFLHQAARVAAYHDFICYYAGLCPMGYDQYVDINYPNHPEKLAFAVDDTENNEFSPNAKSTMALKRINNAWFPEISSGNLTSHYLAIPKLLLFSIQLFWFISSFLLT